MKTQIISVIKSYLENSEILSCEKFGNGHINGTYRVLCKLSGQEKYYILQNINLNVFHSPENLMSNIERVAAFLAEKAGNPREILHFLKSNGDTIFHKDQSGEYWRMYEYIDRCSGIDRPNKAELYECALAFGRFQNLLSDFPADTLFETIPDFHNTPKRYRDFLASVKNNLSKREDTCLSEIELIKKREGFYPTIYEAYSAGKLPLRVCHNDTKCNNVLLDDDTKKAVCIIDLDTIMPGFAANDFGDSIRFGANTADEDETDLSLVKLDIEKFEIFTKGFITGCGGKLTKDEIELLPEGALMMTLECGMRFLADYLDGDIYFKTSYPEHNLIRTRTQLKLASEMEQNMNKMKDIVKKYI